MLTSPLFDYGSCVERLGAKVGPSGIRSGITEFDAVVVEPHTTSGGRAIFRCVDADGVIHAIKVEAGVNSGHNTFFPGAVVERGAQLGNETSVPANFTVLAEHQLQVRNLLVVLSPLLDSFMQVFSQESLLPGKSHSICLSQ